MADASEGNSRGITGILLKTQGSIQKCTGVLASRLLQGYTDTFRKGYGCGRPEMLPLVVHHREGALRLNPKPWSG